MLLSHANMFERTFTNYTNPLAPYPRGFEPRLEILRENHTLTLIAVGLNNNKYINPVQDPLFKAIRPSPITTFGLHGEILSMKTYEAELYARALGCQEQVSIAERPKLSASVKL
jgi:hypothetical protein